LCKQWIAFWSSFAEKAGYFAESKRARRLYVFYVRVDDVRSNCTQLCASDKPFADGIEKDTFQDEIGVPLVYRKPYSKGPFHRQASFPHVSQHFSPK
jgi:hypothetical protein